MRNSSNIFQSYTDLCWREGVGLGPILHYLFVVYFYTIYVYKLFYKQLHTLATAIVKQIYLAY